MLAPTVVDCQTVKVSCHSPKGDAPAPCAISFEDAEKSFDGQEVFSGLNMSLSPGEIKWLTWPSGAGKTTVLRILAGLEKLDQGRLAGAIKEQRISYLFQEDRLCLGENAIRNLWMVTGSAETAKEALAPFLEKDLWEKPCAALSGGEKRRVALTRALAAKSSLLLLDEPFAGLDDERVRTCWDEIQKRKGNRTLLIASHLDMNEKK